ncbi:MAG: hypothetical protein A2Z40_01305 [Deltaproteobacteria bacterium RBG_19FT_COMBO_60_16]|nr:MAG: hypothetical protein A2Z40_01305 [Deltaproteobacteria bacterium RBG_19FT_COMBO_60_16]
MPHVHVKILNPRGADLVQGPGGGERPHGPEGRTPFVHLDGEPFRPRTHDFPSPDPTGGDQPGNHEGDGCVGHRDSQPVQIFSHRPEGGKRRLDGEDHPRSAHPGQDGQRPHVEGIQVGIADQGHFPPQVEPGE